MLPFLFPSRKPLVGVVHLPPLPGSPRARAGLDGVLEFARRQAKGLLEAGFDGLVVENYGDAPFFAGSVPPETVAALAVIAREIVALAGKAPVGVNVLRNDARAALGIAAVSGASFIRVNVHSGVAATDQGIVEGKAAETLRARELLGEVGRDLGRRPREARAPARLG
jgi:membrane complex biogenesis BtpA family protein